MFEKLKRFMARDIPTKWAVVFIAAMVIFFLLLNVLPYLTIPEWMITYTFYAFMTALTGFVFYILGLYFRDYFEIGKMKKIRRMEALDVLKSQYSRCELSIEHDTKKDIENNETTSLVPNLENTTNMGNLKVREDLQREINQYNEILADYNLFRKASDTYIRDSIEKRVRRAFPNTTKKNNELHTAFYHEPFMKRYFEGETVTCNWVRETDPIVLKNITKDIEESEKSELDVLFKEINSDFQKEAVLVRFRKQKEIIRNCTKMLIEVLQKEISSIDKEFEKYDYLRVEKKEDLKAKEKGDDSSIVVKL